MMLSGVMPCFFFGATTAKEARLACRVFRHSPSGIVNLESGIVHAFDGIKPLDGGSTPQPVRICVRRGRTVP
jgi:hypothetical protein